jgi:hypothetical protein
MWVRGVRRLPFRDSGFVKLVDDVDPKEGVRRVSPREFKRNYFRFLYAATRVRGLALTAILTAKAKDNGG